LEALLAFLRDNEIALGFSPEDRIILEGALSEEEGNLTIVKDTYSDCVSSKGDIKLPDIGMRFILARHIAAFLNTESLTSRKNTMDEIINLLALVSGEEIDMEKYKEALDNLDLQRFLNQIVLEAKPVNYSEIQQFEDMLTEVAKSL